MSGALDRPQGLYALAPAAQPMGQQDMLARLLRGNPDPSLPGYPVMQSAEDRGFAPMPRSFADAGARMAAVLRGDVEPTPEEGRQIATVRGFTEGPATIGAFGRGANLLQNETRLGMTGRQGLTSADTIEEYLTSRNIPYRKEFSRSWSETFGPSRSVYFKVINPSGELKTIRLSDHNYPSSAALDFRYGEALPNVEDELGRFFNLSISPEAQQVRALQQAAEYSAQQERLQSQQNAERKSPKQIEREQKQREMMQRSERSWNEIFRKQEEKRAARKTSGTSE